MGSSAKKKKEKKQDFQKPKLKVGKARPKNTNATNTDFSAKAIVFKQQNLSETGRDAAALFQHNLSLLRSSNNAQRRDALIALIAFCSTADVLPQPASVIINKAQALIIDGNAQVRQQTLKLFKSLPSEELGSIEQILLYARAGMAHLSNDIRLSSLDVMDWLLETHGTAVVSSAGGWLKSLRTLQNLLAWHGAGSVNSNGRWSSTKPATNLGSNKLLVRQLQTLAHLLTAGLARASLADKRSAAAHRAAVIFPLCHVDAHMLPRQSDPFGYLNLFGAPRDMEGEVYEAADERVEVFCELGLPQIFETGVAEAKREAGEVGRAAAMVEKALKLVDVT